MKSRTTRLAIAAAAGAALPALAQGQILSAKRGFADYSANYNNLQASGAGWYYTWDPGPANPGNFDAKHYPHLARSWHATASQVNNIKSRPGVEWVLGF